MKTKFDIKVGQVEVEIQGQKILTPEVNIQTELEFTLGEASGMYQLQKEALAELPGIFKDFAVKFATTMREVDDHVEALYADRMPKTEATEEE